MSEPYISISFIFLKGGTYPGASPSVWLHKLFWVLLILIFEGLGGKFPIFGGFLLLGNYTSLFGDSKFPKCQVITLFYLFYPNFWAIYSWGLKVTHIVQLGAISQRGVPKNSKREGLGDI